MGSSRLPGKVLLPCMGKPMLAHQIDRLRKVKYADNIVVATSTLKKDDAIEKFCRKYNVNFFRGDEKDVLSRYLNAARAFAADVVVRLTADCPLIDPVVIDHVISAHINLTDDRLYVSNTLKRSYPRGMDVEVFSRNLLEEANQYAISQSDREHVTPYLIRNDAGNITQINVGLYKNLSAYRFTLDYPKDYEQLSIIVESGLPDYSLNSLMVSAKRLGLDWHDNSEPIQSQSQSQSHFSRLGLGTAQFGMHYGRFNRDGVPSQAAARNIFQQARKLGFSALDTAHLYGESESVIGKCKDEVFSFEIFTKTPLLSESSITTIDTERMRVALNNSLKLMRVDFVDGLLVHHAQNLLVPGADRIYEEMLSFKEKGIVKNIGVSVYNGHDAEKIIEKFNIDIVQLPINVFDRRLLDSGVLRRLANSGVKIHARSAFLQGLLVANPESLGSHFKEAKPILQRFQDAAAASGLSTAHAALHYLLQMPELDRIFVGVESEIQFKDLFSNFPLASEMDYSEFKIDNEAILNPVLWVE